MNHYKKQEIRKAKERLEQQKMTKSEVLKLADKRFVTADEIKEALNKE